MLGNLVYTPGLVATNCFVLVSGYYHCTSKFKLRRIAVMWVEVFVYSVGILLLGCIRDPSYFSFELLFKALFPVSSERYWFVTAYILLQILAPFLNRLIECMDKRMHFVCCLTLVGVFCVWNNIATLVFAGRDFTKLSSGYSVYWFCVLYMLAAYFRKYVPKRIKKQKWMLPAFLFLVLCTALTRILFGFISSPALRECFSVERFSLRCSVFLLPASLCIFQFFRGLELARGLEKFTASVYPLIFAVYLLHCNEYMNTRLWAWLKVPEQMNNPWMVLYALACAFGIFAVCCAVEWVRRKLFSVLRIEEAVGCVCDRVEQKTKKRIEKVFECESV